MSDRSEDLLYHLDETFPVSRYGKYGQYPVFVQIYSDREFKMLRGALQKYVPLGGVGAMRWGDATRVQCAFDHPVSYGFCKYGCYHYPYITSYDQIMHEDNSKNFKDFKEMSVLEFVRWLDKTPGTSVNPEDFDSMF